ncbi:hypothetical protein PSW78_23205, partial [Shigella flexneri]|nr:hypothetical protein [Shigella flexneri]
PLPLFFEVQSVKKRVAKDLRLLLKSFATLFLTLCTSKKSGKGLEKEPQILCHSFLRCKGFEAPSQVLCTSKKSGKGLE